MNAVIVTGATSMLGIATIQECIKRKVKVTALSRSNSQRKKYLPQSEFLTLIECDLDELGETSLPREEYDVFYHFGWCFSDRTTRDDPILQSKNIGYTLDAVQMAYRYGCKKFVGAGSQAEYGNRTEKLTESMPVMPGVCYGYVKYAAGKLAGKLCDRLGIVCVWTRTFSVYGRHDNESTMVSYALRQYCRGETARFSPGLQLWDFLYEKDAGIYFYLLGEKAEGSNVVNVASGDTRPLRDYIEEMACAVNACGKGVFFRYELDTTMEDTAIYGIDPDVRKLREMTGYVPQVSFTEGIRRILEVKLRG